MSRADVRSLADLLDCKLQSILEWLQQHAPEALDEQRHLQPSSDEQVYWHYGYASALRDLRNCFPGKADWIS